MTQPAPSIGAPDLSPGMAPSPYVQTVEEGTLQTAVLVGLMRAVLERDAAFHFAAPGISMMPSWRALVSSL